MQINISSQILNTRASVNCIKKLQKLNIIGASNSDVYFNPTYFFFFMRIKVHFPQNPNVTSDEMKTVISKILGIIVTNETFYLKEIGSQKRAEK